MNQNTKRKKILLLGLGVGALGALGFFGYRHYQKMQGEASGESGGESGGDSNDYTPLPSPSTPSYSPAPTRTSTSSAKKASDGFPLKQGSRGENVKRLQEALISQVGNFFGGADGIFGKATADALKKAGYPTSVDESTFNVVLASTGSSGGSSSGSSDATATAKAMYAAVMSKSLSKVLSLLKGMKSVADYSSVSEAFKTYRINAVRQTLVNGLLNAFSKENEKQQIRIQFTRMGLKYNGSTWSLSGIDAAKIITIMPSVVWKDSTTPIQVPANMVLGTPISEKAGYTSFKSFNNQQFLIQSSSIKLIV